MRTKTEIVILNWNGAGHLRRFLPCGVASVPEGVGVVVADNGSTDDSARRARAANFPLWGESYWTVTTGSPEVITGRWSISMRNISFCSIRMSKRLPDGSNRSSKRSIGIGPWLPSRPSCCSLVEPAAVRVCRSFGGFIDYLGYPFCRGRILQCVERDEGQYDDARDVFWASGAAFCCRAEVFRAMGGFDEDFFAHMEEIDLCWRMQLAGYRVRIEPRSRVYHLGGGSLAQGSPSKVFYNHRNNLAMLYKCASPVQRSVVAVVRPVLDSCAALSYLMQGCPDSRAGRGTCVAGFSAGAQGAGRQAAGCSRCGEGEAPGHILRVDRSALFIRSQTVRQVAVKGWRFECDRCLMCRCSDGGDLSWR